MGDVGLRTRTLSEMRWYFLKRFPRDVRDGVRYGNSLKDSLLVSWWVLRAGWEASERLERESMKQKRQHDHN